MPKTTYVWDELSDNVIEEYEDGVLSVSYTHEPGLYGNLLSQNRNGVTSYYHYDGREATPLHSQMTPATSQIPKNTMHGET